MDERDPLNVDYYQHREAVQHKLATITAWTLGVVAALSIGFLATREAGIDSRSQRVQAQPERGFTRSSTLGSIEERLSQVLIGVGKAIFR